MPLTLAARIMRSGHVRGATVAVGLALVPLIVVGIVADGMIEGITARYVELETYHVRTYLPRDADALAALETVRGLEGVSSAFLEIGGEGLLRSETGSTAVQLRCIDPALGQERGFSRYLSIHEGAFALSDPGSALLGAQTAEKLGVRVGDELQLATVSSLGKAVIPRLSRIHVTGIFGTGYQELDKNWVFLSVSDGERLLAAGRRDRFIGVKIPEPFGERAEILLALRSALPGSSVWDWYQLEAGQFRSLETTRNLLLFIMGLIVLVGSVNVSSAVLMIVLERRMDIGILKSMGASPADIRRSFLAVGLCAGTVGCAGGVCLGLLLGVHVNELFRLVEGIVNAVTAAVAWTRSLSGGTGAAPGFRILGSAYYLESVPVRVHFAPILGAAAGTIGLSVLAAWLPARRAGRLRPLEVIRRH